MHKAPSLSLVHGLRKPLEIAESTTPSPSTHTEPERVSVAPSASSATSRTWSWLKADSVRAEVDTRVPHPGRYIPDLDESISETLDSHRIVIAIDYGTTFTGLAYATPSTDPSQEDLSTVQVIMNWGPGMTNEVKIPSVISYSPATSGQRQFGADLSPDAVAMVNTKLELDVQETRSEELDLIIQVLDGMKGLNFDHIKASKGMPEYTWKTPEDVVTNYLTKTFDPFWEGTEYMTEIRSTAPVDIVVTVPVKWSYRARNSTFKAIRNAGFNHSNFPRLSKYVMISEPEAAAIYTTRYIQDHGCIGLKLNQCFILCDAGGGTVDVVGYRVKQVTPALELEPMTTPTGAKCGSSFINTSFKKWLRRRLGDEYKKLDPKDELDKINASATESGPMRELMRDFEAHKKAFAQDCPDMPIDLPKPLTRLNIPKVVNQGELVITNKNMRSFFDPHVDQIIELIQGHIMHIEERGRSIAALLLIGGFSESQYLQEELTNSIVQLRGIRLHRPDTSWSAVVQGAALYGMELSRRQNVQVMIPCPRHYGLKMNASYSKKSHDPRDSFTDALTNQYMASQQLTWLIHKGDLLLADEERVLEQSLIGQFRKDSTRVFTVPVYQFGGDEAPSRYHTAQEDITELRVLTADFAKYPLERFDKRQNHQTRVTYYEAYLVCKLTVKGMTLIGEMWWYDQCMDRFTVSNIDQMAEDLN